MFSDFKFSGVIFLLIALYGVNLMYSLILRERNKVLTERLNIQNQYILQYKVESDKWHKESKVWEKKAHKEAEQSAKHIDDILNQKVSDRCEDSISWGIKQAEKFNYE